MHTLSIGTEVEIYATKYHLYDCDAFTREYFKAAGAEQKLAEQPPQDAHREKRQAIEKPKKQQAQQREFQLAKFLELEGKVLRFLCAWDTRSQNPQGERNDYILAMHLTDDTIEVREIRKPNDGKGEGFTLFLKRTRIPKGESGHVTDADLGIGAKLNVLGREFLIYDMDKYTREYYAKKYNKTEWPKVEVEPVDSGGATTALFRPESFEQASKPPPMANRKALENQGKLLRFQATLETDREEYKGRLFGVAFWLADDCVSVAEFMSSDARKGQRFLERGKYKNPTRAGKCRTEWEENFQSSDFYVGAVVHVSGWKFHLTATDDQTLEYMESCPWEFPYSNLDAIFGRLSAKIKEAGQTLTDLKNALEQFDPNKKGIVSQQQFKDALPQQNGLVEQEFITIMRRFEIPGSEDENTESKISYPEVIKMLSAY